MNWNEVLQGLKMGKKYRRKCWSKFHNLHIIFKDKCIKFFNDFGELVEENLYIQDFEATDWEEVV